jgi:alpha-tubulin suppressor-like RCC1 family protein
MHTCASLTDGTVRCWGNDTMDGQLGNGTNTNSRVPVPVTGLANVATIETNFQHSCASLDDGTAMCWGNAGDQLGTTQTLPSVVAT